MSLFDPKDIDGIKDDSFKVIVLTRRVELLEDALELERKLKTSGKYIPLSVADLAVASCEKEIAGLKAELTDLKSTADYLKAENERLRSGSFVTAVPSEEYERLKAEVDGLKAETERLFFLLNKSCLEKERLRKAGEAMYEELGNLSMTWPLREAWTAARDGKPTE